MPQDPAPATPLSTAIALGSAANDTARDAGRPGRFEVRALVDEVADALRSDEAGERNYHLCRASATALTLWASTQGLAGGRRVADLADRLRRELAAVAGDADLRLAA